MLNQVLSGSLTRPAVRMSRPGFVLAGSLFFLMLFVPTAYRPIKIVLLVLLLVAVVAPILRTGRIFLHRSIAGWTLLMVLTSLVGIAIGLINQAPGALRVSTVYVLWPILYVVLFTGVRRQRAVDGLMKVMVMATIAIALYALSFVLHSAGWLPDWLYIEIDQGQEIGFYPGFIEFNLYSISSLFFLVPFSLAALLTWRHLEQAPVSRLWLWLSVAIGLTVAFLSGRRALWVVIALSPFIILALYLCVPRPRRTFRPRAVVWTLGGISLLVIALYFYLTYAYEFSLSAVLDKVLEGFDFDNDQIALIRQDQFRALLEGWSVSPIWGAGHGASAQMFGSVRADDQPWAYELSYVALLYQTGLVGFAIYSAGVLWIYRMGLKLIRSGDVMGLYLLPVLSGMTCFLIANATNPYLAKFDCLWVIFLPVGLINYGLLNRTSWTWGMGCHRR